MHLVTAVIKPHKLDQVKEALAKVGITGMTVTEVKGFGRQGGHTETYRGAEYRVDFVPKVKLEIVVDGALTQRAVDAITTGAQTGKIGDGKIWVTPVQSLVRIRTGELDADAV
jgi:nitrogen regulatory protein P-II 1